ncbi:NAD(P)-dependent oxidoreductase [Sulfitobacter aestuariivivens]|uniref:SDR family oxidoreductase n=1 Tax=Sulfitobacter aestuariivivens TaxID=2766981 RepID=A0A927D7X7_9RHOB|nr:NAD(P)-binding oxidoreductase [Sulfitobacter aestuariivivens]MBD3666066.1 SDR family oxidoreductase [Sulfitobacter aestuariivivens]
MKVIVIGATGSVGKLAVEQMLKEGHDVTAFARSPGKLEIDNPALRLVAGDALSVQDVTKAVAGHDAVVVTLGSPSLVRRIRADGTLNVIRAMQATGVRRLICQSTLGAHESWGNLNFFWKRVMFGGLLRVPFADHQAQERLVEASGLDWTIVRPGSFADGPATGRFKEGFASDLKDLTLKITRADIAQFLSRQLTDRHYHQRAVAISN